MDHFQNIYKWDIEQLPHRDLKVITMISNPIRFKTRYNLYRRFAKHMEDSGVDLITVEVQQGERPFAVTEPNNPNHVQLRTYTEIWLKECALNLAAKRLYELHPDWKYLAWIDADIQFLNPGWASEALSILQRFRVIQLWSTAIDLDYKMNPLQTIKSFAWCHWESLKNPETMGIMVNGKHEFNKGIPDWKMYAAIVKPFWHSGFAWAMRREVYENLGGCYDGGIFETGILGCYDDQTDVYTQKGFIPFKELTLNDKVLSLSKDGIMEWGPVNKLHEYFYTGEMFKIQSQSLDLMVTPNHNMLFQNRNSPVQDLFFQQAQDMTCPRSIPKSQTWVGAINPMMYTEGADLESWVAFMGIWLSEGSAYMSKDNHYRISVWQNRGNSFDKIQELLSTAFPDIKFCECKKSLTVSNKKLCQYLLSLGKSREKFIPDDIKNLPPKYLKIFLEWFILGDGSIDKAKKENHTDSLNIYTSSPKMRDDLIEIIIKCGAWAGYRIDKRDSTMADGRVIKGKNENYRIWIQRGETFEVKNRMVSKVQYDGTVYCCATPNHTLLVRRNNKIVWCGNSGDHHMALAFINEVERSLPKTINKRYLDLLLEYQNRCNKFVQRELGYIDGGITHYFHGTKQNRGYRTRWSILADNAFDPTYDLKRDKNGLFMLTDRSIKLRDDIKIYFESRDEDNPNT